MSFLKQAASDNRSGMASAKRVGLLVATGAMSLACVILAVAALMGHDVAMALGAVAVPLAGMNGHAYVGGVKHGEKKDGE